MGTISNQDDVTATAIELKNWESRRRQTLISYLAQQFLVGLEYTFIQATLLDYLTIDMQSKRPKVFYGIVSSGRFVTSMFVTIAVSKWFDRKRKLKYSTMALSAAVALGYALYMIPTSPYLPFVGCVFQGCNFAIIALMNSEIIRVYEESEVQQMMLLYLVAYGAGECAGPACVYLFQKLRYWNIGYLKITPGNFPGLFMLALTVGKTVLAYFFVHDVSLERGFLNCDTLKVNHAVQQKQHTTSKNGIPNRVLKISTFWNILRRVDDIYGRDGLLLIFQQCYTAFAISAICRLPPILVSDLGYQNSALELVFLGISLLTIILSVVIWNLRPSSIGVYWCGVSGLVAILLMWILLLLLANLKLPALLYTVALVFFVILQASIWVCDRTFTITTVGKLCYGPRQSFVEGTRMALELTGALFGSFTSGFLFDNFNWMFPFLFGLVCLFLIAMIVRRKYLCDPLATSEERKRLLEETKSYNQTDF